MLKALLLTPVVLSLAILGAHFMRDGATSLVVGSLVLILLLFLRRRWVARVVQVALFLGTLEWGRTLVNLARLRVEAGEPVFRLALILSVVALVTLGSALLFETKTLRRTYGSE